MFNSQLNRFRSVAFFEGMTLLLLVFIAVPLKYLMLQPLYVSILGPIHGLAFILYVILLIDLSVSNSWSRMDFFKAFVAAILPFGTFINDKNVERLVKTPATNIN